MQEPARIVTQLAPADREASAVARVAARRSLIERLIRRVTAVVRDTRVLLREFRASLIIGFVLVFGGALAITLFYDAGPKPDYFESLFAMLQLLAVQSSMPFPRGFLLRCLFFLTPIISVLVVAEGLVRFGVLLFNRKNRLEAWNMSLAATFKNHVVVAGVGRVGYRIANELLSMGESVVSIEHSKDTELLDALRAKEVPVLLGDARSRERLEEANIGKAKAVIAATDDDLTNVEVALTAREVNPGIRVVIRMFDPRLADKFSKAFDMQTFSTTAISAPVFAAAATDRNVIHSFHLADKQLSIAQIAIAEKSGLSGKSIREIEAHYDASVVALVRSQKVDFHPAPDIVIGIGDRLAVLATSDILGNVERANTGAA